MQVLADSGMHLQEFSSILAGVGCAEILAGTAWDTTGVFGGIFGLAPEAVGGLQALDGRGLGAGAGGRN